MAPCTPEVSYLAKGRTGEGGGHKVRLRATGWRRSWGAGPGGVYIPVDATSHEDRWLGGVPVARVNRKERISFGIYGQSAVLHQLEALFKRFELGDHLPRRSGQDDDWMMTGVGCLDGRRSN